ncbi:MAG: alkaline phosphatase family protein [Candidatus Acidiferrum sp.]
MHCRFTKAAALLAAAAISLVPATSAVAQDRDDFPTRTPIKHVVVIFQENVSFDHYFGTYPHAKDNKDGTRYFPGAKADTPRANTLESAGLLTHNPNKANPVRIDRSVPNTCDQGHEYGAEQAAFNGGLMDKFVEQTGCVDKVLGANSVMDYYDGNTVTAYWNYAQHFAMSDNSFGTTFGPSTPGLLNLVAGNTFEGTITNGKSGKGNMANAASFGAVIGDPDPAGDVCSNPNRAQITMSGLNVGDLLNNAGVTWGSFMGGFANCKAVSTGITGLTISDYIPHHAFFQYWKSTLNANHTPRTSVAMIGHAGDAANHEYDLTDFWDAIKAHNMPAVSFLKARSIEDGHAGYSDPLDEQKFVVNTINALQKTDEWNETAVIIAYDDSDGWYDHVMGPIVSQSNVAEDELLGSGRCGAPKASQPGGTAQNGRCGYGPRLPLLVISPYAKSNYIDHRVTDQSSILRFIEENWNLGRIGNGSTDEVAGTLNGMFDFDDAKHAPKVLLDPLTGMKMDSEGKEN